MPNGKTAYRGFSNKFIHDFGGGGGELANVIHDQIGCDVHVSEKDVGPRISDIPQAHYAASLLINVLHHDRQHDLIIRDLTRVTLKRIIVIETVPDAAHDSLNVFMNDYFSNRFLRSTPVDVPGAYGTPETWKRKFEMYGWHVADEQDLGFDQEIIQARHHLFVFERN